MGRACYTVMYYRFKIIKNVSNKKWQPSIFIHCFDKKMTVPQRSPPQGLF